MSGLSDLLRFIRIAFFNYWLAWVTGTGLIGGILWFINLVEKHRGKQMTKGWAAAILFCVFWFCATFAAWHDADKNLELVKRQREHDTSDLAQCGGDLKGESALNGELRSHNDSLQNTINLQQSTVNSCVVTLTKMSTGEPFRAYVWTANLGIITQPIVTEMVIVGNRPATFRGDLSCAEPFEIFDWTLASGGVRMGIRMERLAPNSYHLETTSPQWEPQVPVIINVKSDETLHSCRFTLRQ